MPSFYFERFEVTVYGPYLGRRDCLAMVRLLGTRFEKAGRCEPNQKSARELARKIIEQNIEIPTNAEEVSAFVIVPFYGLSVILKKEDDGVRVVSWYRTAASAKRAAAKFK
jgi:hypothetical protein